MAKNSRHLPLRGNFRQRLRTLLVRRNHKDQLFIRLFRDKRELLQLYNALNGTCYDNEQELSITTIDDVVYMGLKNDCSFIIGSYLNLYEQQSTFCPNMPLRGLFYFSSIYQGYLAEHGMNLYGTVRLPLPSPQFIVFYNGTEKRPDREMLRLSDAFAAEDSCLEVTATVININHGHNPEIMEKCRTLADYSIFIDKIREFGQQEKNLAAAIDAACLYCIEHDVLRDFLTKHRNEVAKVLLTEYDAKKQRSMDMRDARMEGRKEGQTEKLICLICRKLHKSKSPETIADELEEDLALVLEICHIAEAFAPEFDSDQVFDAWKKRK